jgi:hypothetical protein
MTRTATERNRWQEVTPKAPCPICEKSDWCRRSPDGSRVACRRESRGAVRTKRYKDGTEAFLHILTADAPKSNGKPKGKRQRRVDAHAAQPAHDPILAPEAAPTADDSDIADKRDAVYRRLLARLPLFASDEIALKQRGLSDADIQRGEYRTLPTNGRASICKALVAEMGQADYEATPGLVVTDKGPRIAAPSGLLIPVRDLAGRIVAVKVRVDGNAAGGKYLYLSSAKYGGPGPGAPAHVPAGVCGPVEVVRVTEGELKADVATALSGVPTVSFPGVQSWRAVLLILRDLQAQTVRVAFDADAADNANVARPLRDCVEELTAQGFAVEVEHWDGSAAKGIDDLLVAGGTPDLATGDAALRLVDDIAQAAGVRDDGGGGAGNEKDERKSQSTLLVELAAMAELWHTEGQGIAAATLGVSGHLEHWPVRSQSFRRWLARRFFEEYERAPGGQAVADALTVIEGQAIFNGAEHPVFVRVAGHGGRLYLDLVNASWQVVEIDGDGWRVVESQDCPVRFRRAKAMMALPTPTPGGNIADLQRFANVTPEDWPLLAGWLLAAFRPTGPYPVLALHGEQGSAKSTTARVIRSLTDPSAAPLRCEPRDERDLMIAAGNGWCVCLDNLSFVPGWLSDALCRLSTGGGFATRTLYSDDEETIFAAMRPVILTGIEELANRSDLLDRCVILQLPRIPEAQRQTEGQFWRDFHAAHAGILAAALDAVSAAVRTLPTTSIDGLPRMADFALWATAAESGLGLQAGDFLAAYRGNRATANDAALESSPVAKHILALAETGVWEGTAGELLEHIATLAPEAETRGKTWPKNPRSLSGTLKRLAPNLRAAGVEIDFGREPDRKRRRIVTIRTGTESCVRCVRTVRNTEKSGVLSDANAQLSDANAQLSDANATAASPEIQGKTAVRTQTDDSDAKKHTHSKRARVTI